MDGTRNYGMSECVFIIVSAPLAFLFIPIYSNLFGETLAEKLQICRRTDRREIMNVGLIYYGHFLVIFKKTTVGTLGR